VPPDREAASGPRVVASDPYDGERGVDRAITPRVYFDRLVLPGDVHRANLSLESGGRAAFLAPRFDPVERAIVIDNAGVELDPDVRYQMYVSGVRDLSLHVMLPFLLTFTTGDEAIGEPPRAPPRFADVEPIFMRCADAGCHRAPDPVLGLDLSSAQGVRTTAIGIVAEMARVGVQDERPWHGAGGLAGLARIDVAAGMGRPAQSFLLYKVLGDPEVPGMRMPPPPAEPLTDDELHTLSEWILEGAPTD
jgi:hypothetical protein